MSIKGADMNTGLEVICDPSLPGWDCIMYKGERKFYAGLVKGAPMMDTEKLGITTVVLGPEAFDDIRKYWVRKKFPDVAADLKE
jgi:hypothetical protein